MDAHVLAALVGLVVAGAGGVWVPAIIARIPEVEPDQAHPDGQPDRQADGSVTAASPEKAAEPPEPFATIAGLPGLAWKAAVVSAVAGAIAGAGVGWHWALVMWVPLVPAYVALGLVDWRTRLLPTAVIAPLYGVLVGLSLIGWAVTRDTGAIVHAALGWLVYGGLYALLWFIYPRGLGYGDVRLAGVLGIALGWLGWGPLVVGLYAGWLIGGLAGALLLLLKIIDRKGNPFGPYMLLGALVGVLWGQTLWSRLVGG